MQNSELQGRLLLSRQCLRLEFPLILGLTGPRAAGFSPGLGRVFSQDGLCVSGSKVEESLSGTWFALTSILTVLSPGSNVSASRSSTG